MQKLLIVKLKDGLRPHDFELQIVKVSSICGFVKASIVFWVILSTAEVLSVAYFSSAAPKFRSSKHTALWNAVDHVAKGLDILCLWYTGYRVFGKISDSYLDWNA